MFKKKKPKIEESVKNNTQEEKNNGNAKKISAPNVRINIYRLISEKTPNKIASFIANHEKDNNTINAVNEKYNFKEDLNVIKHDAVQDVEYRLRLNEMKFDAKIKKIDEAISKYSEIVTKIKKDGKVKKEDSEGKETSEYYNKITIENKIKQLKVVRYHVKNPSEGTFEIIGEDGMREIHYLFYDGLLFPYFWGAPVDGGQVLTLYPAMGIKKKVFMEKLDEIFKDYINDSKDDNNKYLSTIMHVATVVMFIGAMVLFVIAYNNAIELPEKYGDRCMGYADQTASIVNNIAKEQSNLIDYALKHKANETNSIVKTTDTPIEPSNKIINYATSQK